VKILLVGASGFIGKNFIKSAPCDWQIWGVYRLDNDFIKFAKPFTNLTLVPCNLQNDSEAKKLSQLPEQFDVTLFVWGNSDIGLSVLRPIDDLNSNCVSLINLISNTKTNKFIFMSSGTVYMGQSGLVDGNKMLNPGTPYGINKLASEMFVSSFAQKTDRIKSFVNIRFFGAYGPMEPQRKIYTNLIRVFVQEGRNEYKISGDGENYIDAMYIDDLILALKAIIKSDKGNLTVDLCRGEHLTINELVKKAAEIFKVKGLVLRHEGVSSEPIRFFASTDTFQRQFGFKPSVSLESGMNLFRDYILGGPTNA